MSRRSYDQFCPLACGLDVIGDRWTLLIVREVLAGPKRFTDLREGLPGIATNLLTERLRQLEEQGILRRRTLLPPTPATLYELTELGRELEEVYIAVGKFGVRFLGDYTEEREFRIDWALSLMYLAADRQAAREVDDTYEFRVGGQVGHVRVEDGEIEFARGPAADPDVVIESDVQSFADLGFGKLSPQEALSTGRVRIEGSMEAAMRSVRILGTPPMRSAVDADASR